MSDLRVQRVRSLDGSTVEFVNGVSGDADGLRFDPKIIAYNPVALTTNLSVSTTQFSFTFDQPIEFSGIGTIKIIKSSDSSVYESFTCGVSAGATIAGSVLQVNTSNGNFDFFTNYIIDLPSVGIANTYGQYYKGSDGYTFRTGSSVFDVTGGDYEQVVVDSGSPTGYYKYNIFTTSGIATFSGPSSDATDFDYVLVGGGGGGGGFAAYTRPDGGAGGGGGAGGFVKNYNSPNIPAGTYTVTIGGGGSGTFDNPTGTVATPHPPSPSGFNQPFNPSNPNYTISPVSPTYPVISTSGSDSSFGPTPVGNIIAYGGGKANPVTNNPEGSPPVNYNPGPSLAGSPGGSGGGVTGRISSTPGSTTIPIPTVSGGDAAGYPGPNQQGYPGGSMTFSTRTGTGSGYSPAWPTRIGHIGGSGGGGAGGSGGTGGTSQPTSPSPYSSLVGDGGNGSPTPEFKGPNLSVINGFPTALANVLGPTGLLAGGGGGELRTIYYNNTAPFDSSGGTGGGGRGNMSVPPTNPSYPLRGPSQRGTANTGGGGGGGYGPGGVTAPSPTPAPGDWYGQNGGSGVMMIRFAHPGD